MKGQVWKPAGEWFLLQQGLNVTVIQKRSCMCITKFACHRLSQATFFRTRTDKSLVESESAASDDGLEYGGDDEFSEEEEGAVEEKGGSSVKAEEDKIEPHSTSDCKGVLIEIREGGV